MKLIFRQILMWRIPTRGMLEYPKNEICRKHSGTHKIFCKPLPALLQGFSKDTFSSTHGLVQGGFLTCSAQSSELKRKTLLNQGGSFAHREFLIGCPSFFILGGAFKRTTLYNWNCEGFPDNFQMFTFWLPFFSLSSSSIVGIVWEPIGVFWRTFKCSTIVLKRCWAKPQSLKGGVLYR